MGAGVSTQKDKTNTNIINEAANKCPSVIAFNKIKLKNINFTPNDSCENPKFSITQKAVIDATCLIGSIQDSLASTSTELSSKSKGGIGSFNVANNSSDTKSNIQQAVDNSCGDVAVNNQQELENIDTTACEFIIAQDANAKQVCEIKALQTMAAETQKAMIAESEGYDPIGTFGQYGLVLIVIPILVVVGGIVIVKLFKKSDDNQQEGGGLMNTFNLDNCHVYVLFLIILIIFANLDFNKRKKLIR
jgi:hypothetical protein